MRRCRQWVRLLGQAVVLAQGGLIGLGCGGGEQVPSTGDSVEAMSESNDEAARNPLAAGTSCTTELVEAIAVTVVDANGAPVRPTSVVRRVNGGEPASCSNPGAASDRTYGFFSCFEGGGGTHEVTVESGGNVYTQSGELTADRCGVTSHLDMRFVVEPNQIDGCPDVLAEVARFDFSAVPGVEAQVSGSLRESDGNVDTAIVSETVVEQRDAGGKQVVVYVEQGLPDSEMLNLRFGASVEESVCPYPDDNPLNPTPLVVGEFPFAVATSEDPCSYAPVVGEIVPGSLLCRWPQGNRPLSTTR